MFSLCCLKSALLSTACPIIGILAILWVLEKKFHIFYILSHKVGGTAVAVATHARIINVIT